MFLNVLMMGILCEFWLLNGLIKFPKFLAYELEHMEPEAFLTLNTQLIYNIFCK